MKLMVEVETKLEPFTVRVNAGPPAISVVGEIEVIAGPAGFPVTVRLKGVRAETVVSVMHPEATMTKVRVPPGAEGSVAMLTGMCTGASPINANWDGVNVTCNQLGGGGGTNLSELKINKLKRVHALSVCGVSVTVAGPLPPAGIVSEEGETERATSVTGGGVGGGAAIPPGAGPEEVQPAVANTIASATEAGSHLAATAARLAFVTLN